MADLFLYGTLCHIPLLEIVLNKRELAYCPAEMPDHAVFWAREGAFPVIVSSAGNTVQGILLKDLSAQDIARLDFYEGGYGYELVPQVLSDGAKANVYFPEPGVAHPAQPWSLKDWVQVWGEMTCMAAVEAMQFYTLRSPQDIARMFPMIRARAASRIQAKYSKHGAGTLDGNVNIVEKSRIYTDFFALDHYVIQHDKFDGGTSAPLDRAVFVGADATIVMPYDPVRDRVLLVEQLRMGPIGRGDPHVWQLEPIAGRIDAGETGEEAALREAQEEAGIAITRLEPVAEVYPSPGTSTEFYFAYVGLADLPDDVIGVSGLESEHEDIRTHIMSLDALLEMVDGLRAANAPLALLAYWLARHRDRLRGG